MFIRDWLSSAFPDVRPEDIALRIEIGQNHKDFEIDWEHPESLMVIYQGRHYYPGAAVKAAMPGALPAGRKISNIARQYGLFVDMSTSSPQRLDSYREFEYAKWRGMTAAKDGAPHEFADERVTDFFQRARRREHERLAVERNIIAKRELWQQFLERGQMTKTEMRPMGISGRSSTGFWNFLDRNSVASIHGETWVLNRLAVEPIRQLLSGQPSE